MTKLKVLDLFSGIGGFSLGLERTGGFETAAFCEIEPFPRRVLAKHWPEVPCYHDVRELTADVLRRDGISVDVICGGFPCQDISTSGRKAGINGQRSGLWSEYARLIGELRPRFVIVENVAALLSNGMGRVLGDLAESGYDAEWDGIPAWFVGSPQTRDRIWIVAYPQGIRRKSVFEELRLFHSTSFGGTGSAGNRRSNNASDAEGILWPPESALVRVADGFPGRVDRIHGLGNSVVPQIPEMIGRAILEAERAAA